MWVCSASGYASAKGMAKEGRGIGRPVGLEVGRRGEKSCLEEGGSGLGGRCRCADLDCVRTMDGCAWLLPCGNVGKQC